MERNQKDVDRISEAVQWNEEDGTSFVSLSPNEKLLFPDIASKLSRVDAIHDFLCLLIFCFSSCSSTQRSGRPLCTSHPSIPQRRMSD